MSSESAHWSSLVGVFDLETTGVEVTDDRIVTARARLARRPGRHDPERRERSARHHD
jgi:hypothetical protein